MTRRAAMVAVGAAALALALGGHAAAAGTDAGSATPGAAGTIRVTTFPILDFAPFWVAMDQGYFKAEGLDVVDGGTGGSKTSAGAATLLVSGKTDLALSNIADVAQAYTQGIKLIVVGGCTVMGGKGDNSMAIVAKKSTAGDLRKLARSGAVLGVNSVRGPGQVLTMNAIEKAGGDPMVVKFQNVPYPAGGELVANGSVASATLIQPFLGAALQNPELQFVGSASGSVEPGTPGLSFVATPDFARANAKALVKYRAAISKAIAWLDDPANKGAFVALAARKTGQKPEVIEKTIAPTYAATLDKGPVEAYLGLFRKYDILKTIPPLDDILSPAATRQ